MNMRFILWSSARSHCRMYLVHMSIDGKLITRNIEYLSFQNVRKIKGWMKLLRWYVCLDIVILCRFCCKAQCPYGAAIKKLIRRDYKVIDIRDILILILIWNKMKEIWKEIITLAYIVYIGETLRTHGYDEWLNMTISQVSFFNLIAYLFQYVESTSPLRKIAHVSFKIVFGLRPL